MIVFRSGRCGRRSSNRTARGVDLLCFRSRVLSMGAENFHVLPVDVEGAPAVAGESRGSECSVAVNGLFNFDEAGFFQPGELDRKIAASEAGGACKKEEVCALACGEHGEDGEARGLVNEAVYLRNCALRDGLPGSDM